jgi:GTPase SAR1 family protein
MHFIVIVGTAGSGKSTLTFSLKNFLESISLSTNIVNLDPAVERLPYVPDFDIREYVDSVKVMNQYNLGPNAALIASIDLVLTRANEIKEDISSLNSRYVIIDTPGQLELFAYRESGRVLLNLITENEKTVTLFLMDSFLAKDPLNYVSLQLLSKSVFFRLRRPQINVMTKEDLLNDYEKQEIISWEDKENLVNSISNRVETLEDYVDLLETIEDWAQFPILISNISGKGINELYGEIQRLLTSEDEMT